MSDTAHSPIKAKIKKLPGSMLEIEATLPAEDWEKHRHDAVTELNKEITLDGFRKGKIPESTLVQKLGDAALVEETAEIAITHAYSHIIRDHGLHPIGRPKVELIKLAKGNPLEFRLTTAVLPDVDLPDYPALAKEHGKLEDTDVSEKELEDTIARIREMRARESGDHHDHDTKAEDLVLPELTDDFVRSLGRFSSVEDFKTRLREQIGEEKTSKAKDRRRGAILDSIAEKTRLDVPDVLIDGEVDRMIEQFKADLARVGGNWEDYLAHAKKEEKDIRKEWRKDGEKRAKTQLIIGAIAKKEGIAPSDDDVLRHVEAILRAYPDADAQNAEEYVRYTETNRLVVESLEKRSHE